MSIFLDNKRPTTRPITRGLATLKESVFVAVICSVNPAALAVFLCNQEVMFW